MVTLFVSHSSVDQASATKLADGLKSAGFAAVFVDSDPDQGIPAGRNWERELHTQLRRTAAVIFLASEISVDSKWCFAELSIARSLGRPVFPLLLQAGARMSLLDDVQWIDLSRDFSTGLSQLVTSLRMAGLDPEDSFIWDAQRFPYPGLAPFGPDDAAVFFGRERETQQLTELLQPAMRYGRGRFVAVVGPSGSGKSSLLHAGLLPRLERRREQWLVLPALVPDTSPIVKLAGCLETAFARQGRSRSRTDLASMLRRGPDGLMDAIAELVDDPGNSSVPRKVLVVVDQAEELLTLTGPREQERFLELVTGAVGGNNRIWAVATLRSEFLSTDPDRAGLADAVDDPLVIEPLSRARLIDVISGPARQAGLEFAPDLVDRMVQETAGGDALPLLAHTLRELYERAGPERRISMSDYDVIGGVVGALQHRAGRVSTELRRIGKGHLVVPTLINFATVTGTDEPTSRRVQRDSLTADEQQVVDAFVEARLLTSDRSENGQPTGSATIEVAHEALLRRWQPLREGIEADRAGLRLRSQLERHTADWEQGDHDESYLLRGARLAAINVWVEQHPEKPTRRQRRFLEACRALTERELEAAQQSNRRLRALSAGLGLLLAAALLAGLLAWQQSREAQAKASLAWSRQLAAQSDKLAGDLPHVAMLAGLQSLSLARGQTPTPAAGLVTALARVTRPSWQLSGHTGPANSVAFSPDGKLLATASDDETVRLWDTAERRPHGVPLVGHTGVVRAAVFSPDGRTLATAGDDRTARLWDVATGRPRGDPLLGHTDWVWGVAFSPDGRVIATAGADRTVRLWDVANGKPYGPVLTGHSDRVSGIAFSPDGTRLATASTDQTVRLWDLAEGTFASQQLTGHAGPVVAVAFSPDGRLLASTSTDRTVRLWDVAAARPHGPPLFGHTNQTNAVSFSPDGRIVAAASGDASVRLWDTDTGLPHGLPLVGHADWVSGVAFSPDGAQLATASADQTVRLWDVAELDGSLSRTFLGHAGPVDGMAVSPDGKLLASAGADHTVRLWDAATARPHGPALVGHVGPVTGVAFSPDGALLASVSGDRTVRLWNVADGTPRGEPLSGHTGWVRSVAFSPDGLSVASAGDDTVRLWDVHAERPDGRPLTDRPLPTTAVVFSPDRRLLASAGLDRTIRLWDARTAEAHGAPLTGHTNVVNGVAFSSDGRLLASASLDRTARIWDVDTGRQRGEPLIGHTGAVYGVAFGPGDALLASTSTDSTVRLWDTQTGRAHDPVLSGHFSWVTAAAFGRDGMLATASSDGALRLWNPNFASWLSVGCRLVNRNLSLTEWNQIALGLPYERTCPDLPAGVGAPDDAPAAQY